MGAGRLDERPLTADGGALMHDFAWRVMGDQSKGKWSAFAASRSGSLKVGLTAQLGVWESLGTGFPWWSIHPLPSMASTSALLPVPTEALQTCRRSGADTAAPPRHLEGMCYDQVLLYRGELE